MSSKLKIIALKNLISQGRVQCVKTYHKNGGKAIAYDFRIDKELVIFCECDLFIDYCHLCLVCLPAGMDVPRIYCGGCFAEYIRNILQNIFEIYH